MTSTGTLTHDESTWQAFQRHRAREAENPALLFDSAHRAEADRLHAIFLEAFAPFNVIPFRRRKA